MSQKREINRTIKAPNLSADKNIELNKILNINAL